MTRALLLLSLALLVFPSCSSTPVLVLNAHTGAEPRKERQARVRFARAVPRYIELEEGTPPPAVDPATVHYTFGDTTEPVTRLVEFQLPFTLKNDTDEAWQLESKHFELGCTGFTRAAHIGSPVVTTVPASSNAKVHVAFRLDFHGDVTRESCVHQTYDLIVKNGEDEEVLKRSIAMSDVHHGKQLGRFAGVFVGLVVVIAIL